MQENTREKDNGTEISEEASDAPAVNADKAIRHHVYVSFACTYAVGKVFSRHFAEGGTFLSFDPEEARAFYEEMFKEGQEVAAELKTRK